VFENHAGTTETTQSKTSSTWRQWLHYLIDVTQPLDNVFKCFGTRYVIDKHDAHSTAVNHAGTTETTQSKTSSTWRQWLHYLIVVTQPLDNVFKCFGTRYVIDKHDAHSTTVNHAGTTETTQSKTSSTWRQWLHYLIDVTQPLGNVFKCFGTRYVIDKHDAHSTAVVRRRDRMKAFLACCVPAADTTIHTPVYC